eukprot:3730355-Rhodomonas_salina.2
MLRPTSASLRAGASLVPSPVTATTCERSKTERARDALLDATREDGGLNEGGGRGGEMEGEEGGRGSRERRERRERREWR